MKKLHSLKLYQDLPVAVQQQLPMIVEHQTYTAGTTLFKEGDPAGSCYLILSGCCGVFMSDLHSASRHASISSSAAPLEEENDAEQEEQQAEKNEEENDAKQEEQQPEKHEEDNHAEQEEQQPEKREDKDGGDAGEDPSSRAAQETVPAKTNTSDANDHVEDNDADALDDVEVEVQNRPLSHEERRRSVLLSTVNDPALVDDLADASREGHNDTMEDDSDLGSKICSLGSGALVGEMGLMNDEPRAASVRCLENSEFLVINRHDFMSCLNAEMQRAREEKDNFLLTHLPGMRRLKSSKNDGRTQVFYLFEKKRVPFGHVFLQQGSIQEDAVFIVFDGNVEFRHHEQPTSASVPRLNRKLSASAHRVNSKSSSGNQASDLFSHTAGVKRLGNLVSGGVFGSMPIAQVPEPFTVSVSSSSCEVFYVEQKNVTKLPRPIQESIREYLTRATTLRLQRLSHSRCAELAQSNSSPALGKGLLQLMPKLPKKIPPPSLQKQKDLRSGGTSKPLQTVARAVLADAAVGSAVIG